MGLWGLVVSWSLGCVHPLYKNKLQEANQALRSVLAP